ncbi:MAG: P-II family nitrogen regulator [Candidatus Nitrosopolaris sp.]
MVKDKSRLPFEVTRDRDEKPELEGGKKRVEVFVNPEKAVLVLSAIKKMNLEATLYDARGYGKERQMITGGGRGTGRIELPSTRHTVMTIVDSHRLKDVITAIKATTSKGRPGGVIAVSPIEDLVNM